MSSILESQRSCVTCRRIFASEQRQNSCQARTHRGIDLEKKKSSGKRTCSKWILQRNMGDRPFESSLSMSLPRVFRVGPGFTRGTELTNGAASVKVLVHSLHDPNLLAPRAPNMQSTGPPPEVLCERLCSLFVVSPCTATTQGSHRGQFQEASTKISRRIFHSEENSLPRGNRSTSTSTKT